MLNNNKINKLHIKLREKLNKFNKIPIKVKEDMKTTEDRENTIMETDTTIKTIDLKENIVKKTTEVIIDNIIKNNRILLNPKDKKRMMDLPL